MDKLRLLLICLIFFSSLSFAQEELEHRDYLYSDEYFDFLIENAQYEKNLIEEKTKEDELNDKNNEISLEFDEEIYLKEEPFKLKIEENFKVNPYNETYKKAETKIIIPTSEYFGFVYNTTQYINKNYSDGRRIITGAEYTPTKWLNLSSGIETNYRDIDQNPLSRKLYFTPSIKLNERFTISFLNKLNVLDKSSDHDIGFNISPFKSKKADFKVFAGISNNQSGQQSQSASFYTNFYF